MKKATTFFTLIFFSIIYSQNTQQLEKTIEYLLFYQLEDAYGEIKNLKDSKNKEAIKWHLDAVYYGVNDTVVIPENNFDLSFSSILNLIKEGAIYEEPTFDKSNEAFSRYNKALNLSIEKKDTLLTKFVLQKILKLTFNNPKLHNILENNVEIYKNYISNNSDQALYNYYKFTARALKTNTPCIEVYEKDLARIKDSKNHYLIGLLNQMLGAQESYFKGQFDKGISYFEKAAEAYNKIPGILGKSQLFGIYNNIAVAYNFKNKPEIALTYFEKAKKIKIPENSFFQKSYNFQAIAQTHKKLKNYDSAFIYFDKEKKAIEEFNKYKSSIAINESNIQFESEKKEKENLQLKTENLEIESKRKQNRNLLLGSLGLLLFGSITFFLIQKNTKRKQLLAIQEKELESQKVTTLLKEQELTAIDSMIEGQEKERQRIANDLHDDLGGLMATVKLHFNALKEKQSPELYKKTNELLDEAYNKVRSVAHAKNSGVMAKKGLLKALNDMAKTVSASNQLQVDIFDHGLDERLENSLELTIFRIVQELITNIIKHAQANEASIHITKHEDSLNIMVEDNGKGFDTKNIAKKSGMGIHSIDKRIENLGGKVTIESETNKGTTIIIDIPS